MSHFPTFGALLNQHLLDRDRTPAWLARRLAVSGATVSRWLNEGARPGSPEVIVRITDILGISAQRHKLLIAAGYGYQEGSTDASPPLANPIGQTADGATLPGSGNTDNTTENRDRRQGSLPQPLTPFVGRSAELAQLAQRLRDPACRLLTLVGPGGIGKTRLAIQAAVTQQQTFADGVHFVNLAPLQNAAFLVSTLVETLNLSGSTHVSPEEVLLSYVENRNILLILDNFEHLRPATTLLRQILAHSPHIKLLVTSRERLNLQGEWLIPLQGLELPPTRLAMSHPDATPDPETIHSYSSIQLFVQCARRVQPDFGLTEENASVINQLCHLVEGFPLAIELAATWLRVMPFAAIVAELQAGLNLLVTSIEDVPDRHRSMRAALAPSWRLLTTDEQRALCRLSIFRGGFTPTAAKAVADAAHTMLLALADKSWLTADSSGRLQMHEFIRQYSAEMIPAIGLDEEELQRRHALYFASFLHECESAMYGAGQRQAMYAIMAEIDNLRTSWQWALYAMAIDLLDMSVESLYWIAWVRCWQHETLATFTQAITELQQHLAQAQQANTAEIDRPLRYLIARLLTRAASLHEKAGTGMRGLALCEQSLALLATLPDDDKRTREVAYARAIQSLLHLTLGHVVDAVAASRHALTDFQRVGDPYGEAYALWVEALATGSHGEQRAGISLLRKSARLLEELGEEYFRAMVLNGLVAALRAVGDLAQAQRAAEQSLALRQMLDDQRGIAACQAEMGTNALRGGDLGGAETLFQACLHTANRLRDQHIMTVARQGLGWCAHLQGEWEVARQHFEQSLAITLQTGRQMWTAFDLYSLGAVALGEGNVALAQDHLLATLDLACKINDIEAIADALTGIAQIFVRTGKPSQAAQLCAFVVKHPSSFRPLRTEDDLLAQLQATLSPEEYQRAVTSGEQMTVEEAVMMSRRFSVVE